MSLGDRIREIRNDQGLNQSELAERVGTSQSTISQLEKGSRNPSYKTLRQVAEALGVSVSYLVEEEDVAELTDEEEAFFREYRGLSEEARDQLREYSAFLRQRSSSTEEENKEP